MRKITHPDFILPEVLAMQVFETANTGANRPLAVKTVDIKSGKSEEYYLKYRGANTMSESACGKELLACFIAAQMEIAVPSPAIVIIGDNFLETVKSHPDYQDILKGKGKNFGSKYLKGNNSILLNQVFTPNQLQQAARIFVFDIILSHSDRNPLKPNMFVANDEITIIDHEKSFGFLAMFSFISTSKPYELDNVDVNEGKKHFFYPVLKKNKNKVEWDEVYATISYIDNAFWKKAQQLMPENWFSPEDFKKTTNHITQIQKNLTTFKSEIWTKLIMQ